MDELARIPYRLEGLELFQVGVFEKTRFDFKPIETLEADANKAEIHLLTGPNGSGKSTVLYAISDIFRGFSDEPIISRRFKDNESYVCFKFNNKAGLLARKPIQGIEIFGSYLPMSSDERLGRFVGYGEGFESLLGKYKAYASIYDPRNVGSQNTFSFAVFAYSGLRSLQQSEIGAIQEISTPPFQQALSFDQTVRPQLLLQWIANNRAQAALARADGDMSDANQYDLALKRITNLIKEICDLEVEFKLERSPLNVSLVVNNAPIRFDGLPDGLKSIISWVADLSLRLESIPWKDKEKDVFSQPIILLLAEIDIHLHPKWQRRILPAVQKLLPNAQIFASTHSPFVVGSVEDAWVYQLPEANQQATSGVIEGIPSAAGKSYQLILEEIFGVSEEFDIETEQLFADFYKERDLVIKNKQVSDQFLELAKKVSNRGEEAQFIIERELRQVSRLISQEIILA
ncbi:Predicted ATP-binding protein involved in virulence [Thiothrix eikelboomii]|uniref:Predicted ATP-binding protein involved in virulence n=1 Tax=Thiothrix eikelboomii TaxID=92487 RepID=A0A1T4X9H8_9GAMM|nr:AAA family ATPase [Thiothrix eikelboomii]SKA86240.1 Predicted ATP-binding protein involved in virulence [Thiothrix eikelboomii]